MEYNKFVKDNKVDFNFGDKVKKEFVFFKKNKKYIYFDSAMTTPKPKILGKTLKKLNDNNILTLGRSDNKLVEKTSKKYFNSLEEIANFINAESKELIITSGTTDALNQVIRYLVSTLKDGDEIITGALDHASLVLPIISYVKQSKKKIIIKWYKLNNFEVDYADLKRIITSNTKIVALSAVYNTTGVLNNLELIKKIIGNKIKLLLDCAQMIGHYKIDVKKIQADYIVFGSHKVFGPNGIGFLWGNKKELKQIEPFEFGGGMNVTYDKNKIIYRDIPFKFMAGTPNVSNVIATGVVLKWLNKYSIEQISDYNKNLKKYAEEKFTKLKNYEVLNPGVPSSNLLIETKNQFAKDLFFWLEQKNIFVRPGSSCVKLKNDIFNYKNTFRCSFHFYNTKKEIDIFTSELAKENKINHERFK